MLLRRTTLAAAPLRAKMLTDLAHWASIVLLAHAAFSCVHFKSLVDDPKLVPPTDVVIEVLVSVLLATYSSVAAAPPLKPIRCGQDVSPEVQDAAFHAPEFAHVHHRGKALAARRHGVLLAHFFASAAPLLAHSIGNGSWICKNVRLMSPSSGLTPTISTVPLLLRQRKLMPEFWLLLVSADL